MRSSSRKGVANLYDVVISGGGPIGCAVARDIAGAGFSTLVLEEHRHIGEPVQCAGIVSPRTLDLAGVSPRVVLQALRGMRVHSPLTTTLELAGQRPYALVVDRSSFDRELAEQARAAGAEIRCGVRVRDVARVPGGLRVTAGRPGQEFTCRLLIGADGQGSTVASRFGLAGPMEKVLMYAAEVDMPAALSPLMEVFLGRETAPGWFGWVVPAGAGRARVGTGVSNLVRGKRDSLPLPRPKAVFDTLRERHPEVFQDLKVVRSTGGLVPIGFRTRTFAERVMLVGDAACQVKPVSGGGLYLGLKGAAHCARTAVRALTRDRLDEADLAFYQQAWQDDMGDEIRCGLRHREVFLGFSDRDMEFLLRFLNKPYWRKTILRHGDIDHPSRVADKLSLAGPWAEKFAPAGLGLLIRGCSALAGIQTT